MQIELLLRRETNANPLSQTRQIPSWQLEQFAGQRDFVADVGTESKADKETLNSFCFLTSLLLHI